MHESCAENPKMVEALIYDEGIESKKKEEKIDTEWEIADLSIHDNLIVSHWALTAAVFFVAFMLIVAIFGNMSE